ncbi:phage tail assembly protein T [Moraxella nasicaprae]|uniref:Phage tail protein n=1 Tax=Moraxella nasicaprae TaxID=2904122 RepID=A0ABY6F3S4_9GAMM|nr:phage tail protein [Moraxella nasicaprae]UXZ04550.1 phage tail protein [Moraxella nasicaprae]
MFKLAAHLGKTVGELERVLTVEELTEWQAYDAIDPIGGYRTDANFAMLAYLQAGDKDKSIDDFILFDPNPMTNEERERIQAEKAKAEAKAEVAAMIAMFNSKSLRHND